MSLRAAVAACVLLYAELVLSAPLATTERNSSDDTAPILGAVFGCLALIAVCAWLSGHLKCSEIRQILT